MIKTGSLSIKKLLKDNKLYNNNIDNIMYSLGITNLDPLKLVKYLKINVGTAIYEEDLAKIIYDIIIKSLTDENLRIEIINFSTSNNQYLKPPSAGSYRGYRIIPNVPPIDKTIILHSKKITQEHKPIETGIIERIEAKEDKWYAVIRTEKGKFYYPVAASTISEDEVRNCNVYEDKEISLIMENDEIKCISLDSEKVFSFITQETLERKNNPNIRGWGK